jgi:hypothetical protein
MKIEPHVTGAEIKEKLHTADVERQRGKWLVISNALVDPRPAETIALHTATSLWFVYPTVSDYHRLGPASIEEDGRGGRHHAYLTEAEDVAVLESVAVKKNLPFTSVSSLGLKPSLPGVISFTRLGTRGSAA